MDLARLVIIGCFILILIIFCMMFVNVVPCNTIKGNMKSESFSSATVEDLLNSIAESNIVSQSDMDKNARYKTILGIQDIEINTLYNDLQGLTNATTNYSMALI